MAQDLDHGTRSGSLLCGWGPATQVKTPLVSSGGLDRTRFRPQCWVCADGSWVINSQRHKIWPMAQAIKNGLILICPTSAKQGRFLKVGKSVRAAPILDLRLGRLWEERRASAGGLSCRLIFQTSLIVAPPS